MCGSRLVALCFSNTVRVMGLTKLKWLQRTTPENLKVLKLCWRCVRHKWKVGARGRKYYETMSWHHLTIHTDQNQNENIIVLVGLKTLRVSSFYRTATEEKIVRKVTLDLTQSTTSSPQRNSEVKTWWVYLPFPFPSKTTWMILIANPSSILQSERSSIPLSLFRLL